MAYAMERVTRSELARPTWKETARLLEPTRMRLGPDLLAPQGTIIDSGLAPVKGPAQLLFDSLCSCSGLLKHAAATTRPPSPSRR
jgi:hypothetical protein